MNAKTFVPGESVAPDREIAIPGDGRRFQRLVEGDTVKAGQLPALLDDRLARHEVAIKQRPVISARADLAAAEKTSDEAKRRYETEVNLRTASTPEAMREAKLAQWGPAREKNSSPPGAILVSTAH